MTPESPIVILAPRVTDDSMAMWRTCLELGWSPERIQGWRVPPHLVSTQRPIAIYGEPLFAEAVADQMGLALLEPSIEWLTTVPREYLHRDIEMTTLRDARKRETRAFVKPADGKIFEPKVYNTGLDLPSNERVDQDIPVLRSGAVDFRLEVRCFVSNRAIVTSSPYWREDQLAITVQGDWPFVGTEEHDAHEFAESVLSDNRVLLPPACTLDIGRLSTGEWAIIEANPCWGAGLYGCDPKEVVQSIRHAVLRRDSITDEERRWISKRRTGAHE